MRAGTKHMVLQATDVCWHSQEVHTQAYPESVQRPLTRFGLQSQQSGANKACQ